MFEIRECAIVDNDILLWLKRYASKPTNTWKGNDKENARFLLSYNKIAIMFTVANQKAIAFHFHPAMFELQQAKTLKDHMQGMYFIRKKFNLSCEHMLITESVINLNAFYLPGL